MAVVNRGADYRRVSTLLAPPRVSSFRFLAPVSHTRDNFGLGHQFRG